MKKLFPGQGAVKSWHKDLLGSDPFHCDSRAAAAAFFAPAARLCRKAVAAEKKLPPSLPPVLLGRLRLSLRLWQVSQEITKAFVRRGRLLPGMDIPMTLNFAMALGNYSRFFLFSGPNRPASGPALAIHAAFAEEMAAMPAAMSVRGRGRSPAASAARLASAFAAALGKEAAC